MHAAENHVHGLSLLTKEHECSTDESLYRLRKFNAVARVYLANGFVDRRNLPSHLSGNPRGSPEKPSGVSEYSTPRTRTSKILQVTIRGIIGSLSFGRPKNIQTAARSAALFQQIEASPTILRAARS